METEADIQSGAECTPAHGISNGEHARIAVDLLLDAFDATTVNESAIEAALRQADELGDPALSAGVRAALEALAQTRMLRSDAEIPKGHLHLPL